MVVTVVISGASGSAYGMKLVERLLHYGHEVSLIVTEAGAQVMDFELEFAVPEVNAEPAVKRFLEAPEDSALRLVDPTEIADPLASGSNRVDAMVVCPASMGFIGSLAAGLASDLPERAADVMLKERRTLVLVPRETPLSLVHLRNMTALAEAGAVILPAMPAFYHKPRTLDDQVDFVVGKVLDAIGVEHDLFEPWSGP
ncbi:MAG: flavin prenyltransferase UbiX [Coriobacteriia bacterium]